MVVFVLLVMGNCNCDIEVPQAQDGVGLDLQNQCEGQFYCSGGVRQIKMFGVDCEVPASSPAMQPYVPSNEEANLACEIVTGSQESGSAASQPHGALEEQISETIHGSSQTANPPVEGGSYIPPLRISSCLEGSTCKLCQRKLSGAITVAMCGHIFHQQCLERWRSDLCPCCQELMDEATEKVVDSKRAPEMPNGTPVMLHGLTVRPAMNRTYARVISYCDEIDRYTIWHKATCSLYSVKSMHVVSILLE